MERREPEGSRVAAPFRAKARAASQADPEVTCRADGIQGAGCAGASFPGGGREPLQTPPPVTPPRPPAACETAAAPPREGGDGEEVLLVGRWECGGMKGVGAA